jgi:DNA (cytosine-5)-methyltransferase 1
MQQPFTHGSLFSGIGGFDLAAEWMGWENRFHCEWNPFGQRVLKYYWPNAESFHDITKTDFTKYAHAIDLISGGFPCQPYSSAGKRLGKEDERHLWPEMLRAIREIRPRWIVGENVLGLVDWNGGMVFDEVLLALETAFQEGEQAQSLRREGYEVFPYVLPASGVGAPHQRYRVWFVAYARGEQFQNRTQNSISKNRTQTGAGVDHWPERSGHTRDASYSKGVGMERRWPSGLEVAPAHGGQRLSLCRSAGDYWDKWPTQPPICTRNDGLSTGLDTSTLSFSKWRAESVKAAGNAIVPQVALQIFRAIAAYESLHSETL